jgi:hypothetical protein
MTRTALASLLLASLTACSSGDSSPDTSPDASRPAADASPDARPAADAAADARASADAGSLDDAAADAAQLDGGAGDDAADAADAEPPLTVVAVNPGTLPVGGGEALTIIGTGFTGATAVFVYGISVTPFVVVDDSTITLTEPALPPLYDAGDAGDSIGGDYPLGTGVVVQKGADEAETIVPVTL